VIRSSLGRSLHARLPLLLALLLAGCAGERVHKEGLVLLEEGKEEAGIAKLEEAFKQDPTNVRYRADLVNARSQYTLQLVQSAQDAQAAGNSAQATELFRRVLAIDNKNQAAITGLLLLERDKRHAEAVARAQELEQKGDLDQAERILRAVLLEDPKNQPAAALLAAIDAQRLSELRTTPVLRPKVSRPVSFEFRDANLKLVFDALSRTSGVNFLLDKDVKGDSKITVILHDVLVEDAIDLIVMQNQLQQKVLSENSVLVYPPQKEREYQDLMVKSFYMENANVKETVNMLKAVLKTKDLYVDESINLVIMRDTPDAVRLAEKLIAAQDMAEPEVMLEMEVIEVNRSRLLELGIRWVDQYEFGVVDTTGSPFTISDLRNISSSTITMTPPGATATARKTDGDSNTLLNPRVRVRNREKARVVVGDRVPVISSVVTSGTGNPVVTDLVQYLDVGLKLEVQPSVHIDGKVAITVNLEVSNLGEEVRTRNGTVAFRVGTRNAQTVLQMRDGETQVLSGVIRDDDRKSATKLPGLGDLPVLGRLFGMHTDDKQNTEILLSITPHIVTNVVRPGARVQEFWSGSEATLRTRPLTLRTVAAKPGTAEGADASASAARAAPAPAGPSPAMPAAPSGQISALLRGPAQAKLGDTFQVALWMKSDQPVSATVAQLGFDPTLLEAVSVTEGTFLNKDGALTTFSSRIDAAGRVLVRATRAISSGVAGEGTLATVAFRVKQAAPAAQVSVLSLVSVSTANQPLTAMAPAPLGLVLTP